MLTEANVIKVYGEVDTKLAYEVTSLLDVLSNNDPSAVIKLEICSPGGSVLDGLAIVDKIREIPNPVIAFNTGICASMGTAICAACDYAYGSENTQFMIHEMSSGCKGKFRDMKNTIKFDESLNKRLMGIIASKCKKTVEKIMDDAVYDNWMSAEEAKKAAEEAAKLTKSEQLLVEIKEILANK